MYDTALKSSPYFQPTFTQQPIVNRAFNSLSFRGKRGYPTNLMSKRYKAPNKQKSPERASTYGAILCIKNKSTNDDLYALVQGRYTGKWSFPKGHSNEGELPIDCTLREVAEETGIDKLPEPSTYLQIGYGKYFVFYLTEPIPLIPRDTNEIINTTWVTLEEMEGMSLNADANLYRKQLMK